ncbi:Corticosteroid-binding globulin [Thelohanellus kitauei]|uniref:Corticosteroid-binding globulin n=1 Tax=Thelohanellus kitauei TaxID=669202 RepID=A0A0C2MAQ3_THEKT|nr:Corticosteroid-binding globulin [Thelohanellus kitauei]
MAERVNEFTLKLAKFLLDNDGNTAAFSISGLVIYLTLSLVSEGLDGHPKDQLLDLLNCNFSHMEISYARTTTEIDCLNSFMMDEFSKTGVSKSAIFHSKSVLETFKQMALEYYETEMHPIDPTDSDRQQHAINEWKKTQLGFPYFSIHLGTYREELSLLIINECYLRFKWQIPFFQKSTKKEIFKDISMNDITVNLMRRADVFKYYDDTILEASVVFIRFEQFGIFAAIVLPKPDNNVQDLLPRINV